MVESTLLARVHEDDVNDVNDVNGMSAWQSLREKLQGLKGAVIQFGLFSSWFTITDIDVVISKPPGIRFHLHAHAYLYYVTTIQELMQITVDRDCRRPTYQEISQGLSRALIPELANIVWEFCDEWIAQPVTWGMVPFSKWFNTRDLEFFDPKPD